MRTEEPMKTHLGITYTDDGGKFTHRGERQSRELCIMACVFCRDPLFWRWLETMVPDEPKGTMQESAAKAFILSLCQVASRNELDTDQAAAERFHEMVRKPFLAWKEAQTSATSMPDFYNSQLGKPWEEPC